ncbi:metallophosphoesterase [Gracilibacillus sp. S3-1-1]|uniref:Metallophosphoesterase n=1 Tax=Gracilibacillus pellucidus TaxID=3095368 RepID=A0ACC6M1U6_9BACI|nr:metallophosphoesterase [Gracilibacillus sp. S3-1-1]MDX8044866.1 metallophosphoesterase [Gracilibacillus sp. S3-1-1]
MKRRTFLKRLFGGIIGFFGLSGGTYYYAREIEPSMLETHFIDITSKNTPTSFDGYKIVQFTDTHLGFHYTIEQLTELINKINRLEPDLIVFTGDLIDNPQTYQLDGRLIPLLSQLTAKDGKYCIYGNHDHGGYGTDLLNDIFAQSDFELLQNEHRQITKNGDTLYIAGIDDALLGNPDVEQAITGIPDDAFKILLAHEPDYADVAKNYPIDIQISGHSHGGQVQLPFIGYIYTPSLAQKYVEGGYTLGNYPLQLYVSRGIGTTRLPYRFLCKPEITVYQLKKS